MLAEHQHTYQTGDRVEYTGSATLYPPRSKDGLFAPPVITGATGVIEALEDGMVTVKFDRVLTPVKVSVGDITPTDKPAPLSTPINEHTPQMLQHRVAELTVANRRLQDEIGVLRDQVQRASNPSHVMNEVNVLRRENEKLQTILARKDEQTATLPSPGGVTTLVQSLSDSTTDADSKLAQHLNAGWQVLNITVTSDTVDGRLRHTRIVTLRYDPPEPSPAPKPARRPNAAAINALQYIEPAPAQVNSDGVKVVEGTVLITDAGHTYQPLPDDIDSHTATKQMIRGEAQYHPADVMQRLMDEHEDALDDIYERSQGVFNHGNE